MSDAISDADAMIEDATEATAEIADQNAESSNDAKKSLFGSITVYEVLLMVSFVLVGLATLILFFKLTGLGSTAEFSNS